ncbi:MAG: hypothetical protein ABDH21_01210 [bacterium]
MSQILIGVINFGSNSNKFLVSIYANKTLKYVKKYSIVHKINEELKLEKYEEKLSLMIDCLYEILKSKRKKQTLIRAVGTEFYRSSNQKDYIIEINEKYLQKLKDFTNQQIKFEILNQEEESILTAKALEMYIPEYTLIDMGGGSTQITTKINQKYHKFLYKFGCLSKYINLNEVDDFISFYKLLQTKTDLILTGGSFISTLLAIRKIKNPRKQIYQIKTQELIKFYRKIQPLKDEDIALIYPILREREKSVKTALWFINSLLSKLETQSLKISLLTLLEGLTLQTIELNKLELKKYNIAKHFNEYST